MSPTGSVLIRGTGFKVLKVRVATLLGDGNKIKTKHISLPYFSNILPILRFRYQRELKNKTSR